MKKILQFLQEAKVELKDKTTWPSKDEVLNSTVVVVVSIIIVSLALYLVDIASSALIRYVVIEKVVLLKPYVNQFTFLLFVFLFGLFFYAWGKVRSSDR